MGLLEVVLAGLIVVALYLLAKWVLGKLKVGVDNDLLVIGAVILFILILMGRVSLPL